MCERNKSADKIKALSEEEIVKLIKNLTPHIIYH